MTKKFEGPPAGPEMPEEKGATEIEKELQEKKVKISDYAKEMMGKTFSREGGIVELTPKEMADHIASKPELQEKIFGKVLNEEELKNLKNHITPRIAKEVMESMNLRTLTDEEFEKLKKEARAPEHVLENYWKRSQEKSDK